MWTFADLERGQQVLQSATELWQEHHERLLQENGQLRQWAEQEIHSKTAEFESRQAALSADLADARSMLEPLTAENTRLRSTQASLAQTYDSLYRESHFIAASWKPGPEKITAQGLSWTHGLGSSRS